MVTIDERMDLYAEYLLVAGKEATAIKLSKCLGEAGYSHDQISKMLGGRLYTSKELWHVVKPLVHEKGTACGVLIVDDTIIEKAYSDENPIICWHFDHAKGRNVKGMNCLNLLFDNGSMTVPVSYEIVRKERSVCDVKTHKEKRLSDRTKNEMLRDMVEISGKNQIPYHYVLGDTWFSSAENMRFIKEKHRKDFVFGLKSNRHVTLTSPAHGGKTDFKRIDQLVQEQDSLQKVWLEDVPFPVHVFQHRFTNDNGESGSLYLVTSDLTLTPIQILSLYHRRWKVEEFHKSLKSNAAVAASPTHTPKTQANHLFAAFLAVVKLEKLARAALTNHFALIRSLFLNATAAAYAELSSIKKKLKINTDFCVT